MKQCLNTNCIFYTRLEELPDAYIKCPGCGGMLAAAETPPAPQQSSHRAQSRPHTAQDPDDDEGYPSAGQTYAYTYPQSQSQPGANIPESRSRAYNDPYTDPYAGARPDPYAQEFVDDEAYAGGGATHTRSRWTTTSKIIVGVSMLLFVSACVIVSVLMGDRLFPQAKVYTSAQATETALAALRPAVNTPIIVPPTFTSAGLSFSTPVPPPTRQPDPPTAVPQVPTAAPPTETPQPQPPPQAQQPAATAPPPQPRPQAGVISAQMSVSLEGGAPVGSVNAYGPSDPFNLAVQANYGPEGVSSIVTKWYGPDGALIYEMRRTYNQPGTYYAGFTLRTDGSWVPGDYRVDTHTNDSPTPAYSVSFTVIP